MTEADILVVGAGIAGLSAAVRLARHGKVVVCEAESALGVHASGRSAAFAHFAMNDDLVRRLTAASMPDFRAAAAGDDAPPAQRHPALFIGAAGEAAALDTLEEVHRRHSPAYRRLEGDEARRIVPVLEPEAVAGAILDPDAVKLDADAMLQRHRRALLASGGDLLPGARVERLHRDKRRWIAATTAGHFAAPLLVNAAGAWADEVALLAGVEPLGLRPLRRTVITFAAPAEHETAAWPFTKTVGTGFYFAPEGNGRVLACAMDEHESPPCNAQPEEEDVARAAWRIEQATTLKVERIAGKWAGLRTFAPDRLPVAGFDPRAEGFFWLAGQGGFGLQTSPAMARAAEALATGGVWPGELRRAGVEPGELAVERLRPAEG